MAVFWQLPSSASPSNPTFPHPAMLWWLVVTIYYHYKKKGRLRVGEKEEEKRKGQSSIEKQKQGKVEEAKRSKN